MAMSFKGGSCPSSLRIILRSKLWGVFQIKGNGSSPFRSLQAFVPCGTVQKYFVERMETPCT
jgi:hypothetical protein